ncbi:glycoside hydrolase family 38 C-terminal domain-containing protein [Gleimia hominis]|uniref:Glycoside hydrolase family 38 C-terminal domain-containing protein n=1 Tax=Gleimia hominis TaxID=595468 RepID=A0ABU3IA88_9ACTO|nr:glycoside hydrolase family 38 C-terminal domain-containing protein [Gleimia hominis]MDT3767290.1 glycoside hydrolase family 38 C-terminal domain-containing protein [Gleimia hominis]
MFDDRNLVEERISDLVERLERASTRTVTTATSGAWRAPGEPVDFRTATVQTYEPFAAGTPWGPAWSTWWLEIRGQVPAEYAHADLELKIDLGFEGDWPGNQSEGMVYTRQGTPLKAINPMNNEVALNHGHFASQPDTQILDGEGRFHVFVEAGCNPNMGGFMNHPSAQGDLRTRTEENLWVFKGAEVIVRDQDVWGLQLDMEVLNDLMRQLPVDSTRRAVILRQLERAANTLEAGPLERTASEARQVLAPVIDSGVGGSAQQMTAVGHAHIDSAWLWPIRETRRKVVRTYSNVTALAQQYPDMRFACTSAQHYEWLRQDSPEVYARVKDMIARGQWEVVGGMWVEPDANLPSGEALVRQLTVGLKWFQDHLGVRPRCLWLPDSFGYNGALPQIAKLAGMQYFFTQKLNWNQTNTMPHHTFWWEGIDGTRIFTHFPPVDCYDSIVSPKEVRFAEKNFKEKGLTPYSLLPYGYGDGGGGPTREMVERVRRLSNCEGAPAVRSGGVEEFFDRARADYPDAPVWSGEMYLEFHRGVYTSAHRLKQGNRRVEAAMFELEWLATAASQLGNTEDSRLSSHEGDKYPQVENKHSQVETKYPHAELTGLWERMLLLQFHDILPGTGIAWVNQDAQAEYAQLADDIEGMRGQLIRQLDHAAQAQAGEHEALTVLNAAPIDRTEVIEMAGELALVDVPSMSATPLEEAVREPENTVTLEHAATRGKRERADSELAKQARPAEPAASKVGKQTQLVTQVDAVKHADSKVESGYVLDNGKVRVTISADGLITGLRDLVAGRDVLVDGAVANLLRLHPDNPSCFDAWELQHHYRASHEDVTAVESIETHAEPLRASITVTRRHGDSTFVQTISLDADATHVDFALDVDWHERAKVLKVLFPLDIAATDVKDEIPFGWISRPMQTNTPWDFARFETSGQRWMLLDEPGYAVALANDSTYGHDVRHLTAAGARRAGVCVGLTALRSAQAPDPHVDEGQQSLRYRLQVGSDVRKATELGIGLNQPIRTRTAKVNATSLVSLNAASTHAHAVIDSVKRADDASGDLIVRLHENAGTRSEVALTLGVPAANLREVDLCEDPLAADSEFASTQQLPTELRAGQPLTLKLRPFQILTLRMVTQ